MVIFPPKYTTYDKGHGRIETRSIQTSTVLKGYTDFPYLEQVFKIDRVSTDLNGENKSEETNYYITSLSPEKANAPTLLNLTRGHWQIENSLHWVRDVTFDEDRSQIRTGKGPRVMATLRNLAISLFRLNGYKNIAKAIRTFSRKMDRPLQLVGLL